MREERQEGRRLWRRVRPRLWLQYPQVLQRLSVLVLCYEGLLPVVVSQSPQGARHKGGRGGCQEGGEEGQQGVSSGSVNLPGVYL